MRWRPRRPPQQWRQTRRQNEIGPLALLAAPMAWISVFYLVPLGLLLLHAFWSVDYLTIDRTLTLDNFRTISETRSIRPSCYGRS